MCRMTSMSGRSGSRVVAPRRVKIILPWPRGTRGSTTVDSRAARTDIPLVILFISLLIGLGPTPIGRAERVRFKPDTPYGPQARVKPDPPYHRQPLASGAMASAQAASDTASPSLTGDRGLRQAGLVPTGHLPLPTSADEFWLVPASAHAGPSSPLLKRLAEGVEQISNGEHAAALPKVSDPRLARTMVADYAAYYTAVAQMYTGRVDAARRGFAALNARSLPGVLRAWGLLGEAEAAEAQGQFADAATFYERTSILKVSAPDVVIDGLARTLAAAGDRPRALAAYRRLYYDLPLSQRSEPARARVRELAGIDDEAGRRQDFTLELGRAQRLFEAKRYADALNGFEALRDIADGDTRELVALRIAASQFYLGRYQQALDGTRAFLDHASRKAESRFFYLSALRGLGDHDGYVTEARRLVREFPADAWTEDTLNNLATHYILIDEDDIATDVFREYLERFPKGRYAQRAAWKLGWAYYRQRRYQDAIAVFEAAAVAFPRSDYRPPYLYWSAKAYDQLTLSEAAVSRYALISVDYLNSYYGRLADAQLRTRGVVGTALRRALAGATSTGQPMPGAANAAGQPSSSEATMSSASVRSSDATTPSSIPQTPPASVSPTTLTPEIASRIRHLIAAGLYATAIAEVQYARRQSETSPLLEATLAWLHRAQGDLRLGINMMKRAYPQYLTADGHRLPKEAQKVIFPLDYWLIIKRHSVARGLDPYLIAALVAQESNFVPDIRSVANAYGLMQVLPSTGKQLSRALGIRRFSISRLTDPETNVRLGTLYFQRLIKQFGGTHYALASYNAGEHRVERWIAERPPLPRDEFIDDIPFPETQNYVKRILGTAEDYRGLYGQ
jgi:soluble lytic murein transglycosylase